MTDFTYTINADGVAIISWDVPGKSMNVMTLAGFADLDAHVEAALSDPEVKGIVITSGKADFAAGMDLNVIARMRDDAGANPAQGLFDGIMRFHRVLRKIERAGIDESTSSRGKPIVAALPGTALGIGFELPLACHRIIVADNTKAKIGLPEILVGLFPGAGGTTRLVRKLGVAAAIPFLVEGRLSDPTAALKAGLIDEVVPADTLLARACEWVLGAQSADLVKPWDVNGYRMPGGLPYSPEGFPTYIGASAVIHGKTMGAAPAAKVLLSAMFEGALVPFDTALKIEARWFVNLMLNPSSGAMVRSLFINKEALSKGANRPALPDESVRKVGILGAGMMGAGIAHVSALAGISVLLLDSTQAGADRGRAFSDQVLEKSVKRGTMSEARKAQVMSLITATTDYELLRDCDLIIEAVFEDPQVKAEVTARAEAVIPDHAIFATNTSTLPISLLAEASRRPDQFIGIHFFSPVERMALVEIIKGRETGNRAVAKALDFVRQIRKTPIVVNDARFFYANRCIIPYLNEGIRMVGEGVTPILVDNAAKLAGMPIGPLQLVDETSIDLGVKIAKATKAAMGDAYGDDAADAVLFRLLEEGRLGRKANAGFFAYSATGRREGLWPGLATCFPRARIQPDVIEVQRRLMFAQALEAVRALEAGVLTDIREGDVGAILGWGFAPWSGGPFSWLDILGTDKAVAICDELASRHGSRFSAPDLLRDMSQRAETFYSRFGAQPRAA
jgi:3-hydroxyacyl-CoA dehydrogenase/enoyl-CoA hydratase/3-hydroxybutyryl-CoA epimerase